MLFAKGDLTSIHIMFKGLESFADASGLHANSSKSAIYLAVLSKEHQFDILRQINLPLRKLPFRYLGVPLNSRSISAFDCEKLVDKMTSKIRGWQGQHLSYAASCNEFCAYECDNLLVPDFSPPEEGYQTS